MGCGLHEKHMWPLLKAGGGTGTDRDFAVVANISARVGSIGDNRLGGWHSYRASKSAINQCMDYEYWLLYRLKFPRKILVVVVVILMIFVPVKPHILNPAVTKTVSVEFAQKKHPIVCILLHPGTVDTDLSKPFQRNVPGDKLFTKEFSVAKLLSVINNAKKSDNGKFFAWDGQEIPWWNQISVLFCYIVMLTHTSLVASWILGILFKAHLTILYFFQIKFIEILRNVYYNYYSWTTYRILSKIELNSVLFNRV